MIVSMAFTTPRAFYFVVSDRQNEVYGFTWRAGIGNTSFYIKSRAPQIGLLKVSLHGPDPRPDISAPGFKVAIDQSSSPRMEATGGAFIFWGIAGNERWFSGRQVEKNVRHVATFHSTPEMFRPGVPTAPNPGKLHEEKDRGSVIPPPTLFRAADVDLFISTGAPPYWWNQVQALGENSCFGPIRNNAGQHLTGQSVRRPVLKSQVELPTPVNADDKLRGIVAYINTDEVLIVEERWISKSYLVRHHPRSRLT
jgi:hypothetical protein